MRQDASQGLARSVHANASSLPTELIQEILTLLGPYDFDAARHTCRQWLRASLYVNLLCEQLKRAG